MKNDEGGTNHFPGKKPSGEDVDLYRRTKAISLRIIKLYSALPKSTEGQVLGRQILRSGTSVGAHYWEARHSRSTAEFVSKLQGGLQELNETLYWLELLCESGIMDEERLKDLKEEANELMAIFIASVKTAKRRGTKEPRKGRQNLI